MIEWRVRAELSAEGELHLVGALLDGSPVDLLVAAIAGCFVRSCHVVQDTRGEDKTVAHCEVTGTKADDAPNRVGQVRTSLSLPGLDVAQAGRTARDA